MSLNFVNALCEFQLFCTCINNKKHIHDTISLVCSTKHESLENRPINLHILYYACITICFPRENNLFVHGQFYRYSRLDIKQTRAQRTIIFRAY